MSSPSKYSLFSRLMVLVLGIGTATTLRGGGTAGTPAVGGMPLVVPAGETRAFSLPLSGMPSARGTVFGRIGSVGPDWVDVPGAGWTANAFLPTVNPYYLRLRSGGAAGRILLVESNSESRLDLNTDGTDLSQTGGAAVAPGDAFELVPADTLGSLFGSGTLQGGEAVAQADNVLVWAGADYRTFYFNSKRQRWEDAADPASSCDTFVLRPDRGFLIVRHAATDLRLNLIGRVPESAPRLWHARPGVTLLGAELPVDTTLGALSLQNRAKGWRGSGDFLAAYTEADLVEIRVGSTWKVFYFDRVGQHWQLAGNATRQNQDGFVVPAGAPLLIHRLEAPAAADDTLITLPAPGATP